MASHVTKPLVSQILPVAKIQSPGSHDYNSLLNGCISAAFALIGVFSLPNNFAAIGDSRIVMIGEASHGTHEFYSHRAEITRRLIMEKVL